MKDEINPSTFKLQIPSQTLILTVNPKFGIGMKLQTKKRRSSILFAQGRRKEEEA